MRRVSVVVIMMLFGANGCDSSEGGDAHEVDTANIGRTSSAWTSDPVTGPFCNVGGGDTAVAAKWSSTLVGSYAASKTLSGSVTNRLPVDATISVDVRAAVSAAILYRGECSTGWSRPTSASR